MYSSAMDGHSDIHATTQHLLGVILERSKTWYPSIYLRLFRLSTPQVRDSRHTRPTATFTYTDRHLHIYLLRLHLRSSQVARQGHYHGGGWPPHLVSPLHRPCSPLHGPNGCPTLATTNIIYSDEYYFITNIFFHYIWLYYDEYIFRQNKN